jgi:enoyl-CoA hydratase/carnithine racemase
MTDTDQYMLERSDGVLTLTFTREAKLNAVSSAMVDGLRAATAEFGDDDKLRVFVITARGRYFTAGIDILDSGVGGTRGRTSDGGYSPRRLRREYRKLHLILDELEAIEKPTVLAAQGPCLGFGVELSASCDFRLASRAAHFALPELPNLAVIAGSGGVSRITRLVGPHWGKWLAIGEPLDSSEALRVGLVHAVYPEEEFAEQTIRFARKLAALPSEALGVAKVAVDVAADVDRRTARDFDRYANTILLMSDEHNAMTEAFRNRRKS